MTGKVICLMGKRKQKERAEKALERVRTEPPPQPLVDSVLGPFDDHFAERLTRATGLQWPAPGLAERTVRAIRRGR